MSHDEKQIVIKTKYVKYGCITMAIMLLIAAIGTGIWLHQQLNASGREAYSQNPKDDSCDGVDCGLEC